MAKNQTGRNTTACEKIRKATFGMFRRVDSSISSKTHVPYSQPLALHPLQQHTSNEIPIEFVPSLDAKYAKNIQFSSTDVVTNEIFVGGKELVDQKTFGEAKFDSFIGREKMKMSAPSDVGVVKTFKRYDTFDEKVSSFIDQTKLKFHATYGDENEY
ncbi:hypothetical protein QVD17_17078 [Tagetes erecta]|uniref:Uncharacterized protein n=1 Tax=Tagetes erecta TaxID=13708 RepID=A0AAD8KSI3_TARER|nr:hypothetical protein QVD17_17078 [Tagetes erecta]